MTDDRVEPASKITCGQVTLDRPVCRRGRNSTGEP
jgi:hypothetical protein